MTYTTAEVIDIAKVSQVLAAQFIATNGLYGGSGVDRRLPRMLYIERKSIEWLYGLDPTDTSLVGTTNYVYALCGRFGLVAARIIASGNGGTVAPITPPEGFSFEYLIPITASQFANATEYNDTRIVGKTLQIFWNNVNRYIELADGEWTYTPTGIQILIDGFDSTTTNADAIFKIYIVNPTENDEDADSGTGLNYNLTANTAIPNLTPGNDFEERTVAIIPNGFDYTWGSTFAFSDNWPEQPSATAANTFQLYTFRFSTITNLWACVNQSLNIPI
jgi:hypothetical protein